MMLIHILSILVNLANAYIVARFGKKLFATTLAGSFLFSCIAIGIIVESSFNIDMMGSPIYWGVISFISLLILILSNPLRYLIAYGFFFLLLITALLPFDLPTLIKDSNIVALIILLIPILPVVFFRKEIKDITIGLSSGGSLGFGLIAFINLLSKPNESIMYVYALLYLLSVGFGVYFQFKLFDKVFGKTTENKVAEV